MQCPKGGRGALVVRPGRPGPDIRRRRRDAGHARPSGVRGDLEAREFIAFWLTDGRVRAGMNVNVWDVTDSIKNLIRSGHRADANALADPGTSLDDLAAG